MATRKPVVVMLGVRIPKKLRAALEAACEAERRTLAAVVVVALEDYLSKAQAAGRIDDGAVK